MRAWSLAMDFPDLPITVWMARLETQADAQRWIDAKEMGPQAKPQWLAFLRWYATHQRLLKKEQ